VLEWDPIQLATADLISLALYRNGQKAGNIPKPLSMHTTKISGLAVDTEYTFHLVLRTTAGTFASQRVAVRTHKMTDLSGITITTGILPPAVREGLVAAVERIGAKIVDGVRIDTTHFVTVEGRGVQWEKANELNIPVVRPEWVEACERNGRILGVTKFYLDAVRVGPGFENDQQQRPGTAGTTTTTTTAAAPPSPPRKDSTTGPSSRTGMGSSSQLSSEPAPAEYSAASQKEEGGDVESESSDSEQEPEEKVKSPDEQKVLADERNQKRLAERPKPTVEDDDDDEMQGDNEASEDEKGGKSPGDGSSFQDVAL
jgi:hypothetical protein